MYQLQVLTFCLMISSISCAQGLWKYVVLHPDSAIKRYDTTFVKPNLNRLSLRYFLNVKQAEVEFKVKNDTETYGYRAGDFLRYGFGFGYRWLILNYSYGIDPRKTREEKGDVIQYNDIQMNIFGQKFLYDLRAQWYTGFNYKEQFRPDVNLMSFGGSLRYNFNHKKYSFKHSYDQTQWQLKSAGAPIAGINFSYTNISSDSTIYVGSNNDVTGTIHENINMAFGGGYSYTFVYKKNWSLTLTFTLYLDGYRSGTNMNVNKELSYGLNIIPESRAAFGYNNHNYFFGFQGSLHELPSRLSDNVTYRYKYNNLKILFVHRMNFNPFKNNE